MGTRSTLTVSRKAAIDALRVALARGDMTNETLGSLLDDVADLDAPSLYNFIVMDDESDTDDSALRALITRNDDTDDA